LHGIEDRRVQHFAGSDVEGSTVLDFWATSRAL
jgi:hypothetical protein